MSDSTRGPLPPHSSTVQKLAAASTKINSASDRLQEAVSQLEAQLKQLNLGVHAWVLVESQKDPAGNHTREVYIGYSKIKGRWALSVSEGYDFNPEEETEWLFGEAPRDLRIAAARKLPALVEKLLLEAERTAADVLDTAESVTGLTEALKALTPPTPSKGGK